MIDMHLYSEGYNYNSMHDHIDMNYDGMSYILSSLFLLVASCLV
jgi:hypothetical protein